MKFKSKLLIALVAVAITFLGFSLMISPSAIELARADQDVELLVTYDAGEGTNATLHYFFIVFG